MTKGQGTKRARHSRVAAITLDDLRRLFHVPLQTAADHLRISETMVKRVSRRFGIKKWPYRQIRWIDIQIDSLERQADKDHGPSPDVVAALQLLDDARSFVLDTGDVPSDMVQRLCFDMKRVTGKHNKRATRSPPEEGESSASRKLSRTSTSSEATSDCDSFSTPTLTGGDSYYSENDSLLANAIAAGPMDGLFNEWNWSRVDDDEKLFADPNMVLINAACYIFDSI